MESTQRRTHSSGSGQVCQSCQAEFAIAPEDFAFYKKIDVPPPTWCPGCRAARRFAWRNEWQIFRRPDATGREVFSVFSPSAPVKVLEPDAWYADSFDPLEFGRAYDFTRPFFAQLADLLHEVPLLSRPVNDLENSDFSVNANHLKNCYLVRNASGSEDCAYLSMDTKSRSTFDCTNTSDCELCYGSLNLANCYQAAFSRDCEGCRQILFCRDCVGCQDCLGCVNLHNQRYRIFNQQYSKEEYEAKLAKLNLRSHAALEAFRAKAHAFWATQPVKFMHGAHTEQVSGEYLYESKNVHQSYLILGAEDCKYCQQVLAGPSSDCYDLTAFGEGIEQIYECAVIGHQSSNLRFSWNCWTNCRNLQYSMFCQSASDCFGCIGIRGRQHCILNKQYSKEEYEALVPKIIAHMNELPYTDTKGRVYRYGEFFPAELSPFEYNVTIAEDNFPRTKDEVLAEGCRWYEQPAPSATIELTASALPDSIESPDAAEHPVGKVIECPHRQTCGESCTGAYTIIAQEAAFLFEHRLSLPRLCPNCRLVGRIKARNPMTLHHRQCACTTSTHGHSEHCPTEFETSYAPERPEIVYCESCYQQEVT